MCRRSSSITRRACGPGSGVMRRGSFAVRVSVEADCLGIRRLYTRLRPMEPERLWEDAPYVKLAEMMAHSGRARNRARALTSFGGNEFLVGVQDQFLQAPVVHVRNVERILVGAGNAMHPIELADVAA